MDYENTYTLTISVDLVFMPQANIFILHSLVGIKLRHDTALFAQRFA